LAKWGEPIMTLLNALTPSPNQPMTGGMVTSIVGTLMTVDQLIRAISKRGNALWNSELPDHQDGVYIRLSEPLPFTGSLLTWWTKRVGGPSKDISPLLVMGWLVLLPFELVQLLLRPLLFPIVWLVWSFEKLVASWLGYDYFCPLCHNATNTPFVYCPKCRRVQGLLAPSVGALFRQPCAECGEVVAPTLGNHLLQQPKNLVCRDTRRTKGCYRPLALPTFPRTVSSSHSVIFGGTVAAKHAVLSHLVAHALQSHSQNGPGCYRIPWDLNQLEWSLMEQFLSRSYSLDTSVVEELAPRYTLARTFILQKDERRLLVLHNLVNAWVASEKRLYTEGIAWKNVQSAIFVVDPDVLAHEGKPQQLTHAEIFSRMIRVIEKDLAVDPGHTLPLRVAVVVPLTNQTRKSYGLSSASELSPEMVEQFLGEHSPATYSLLRRTVGSTKLAWFGGAMPATLDTAVTFWLKPLVKWLK
jgi:hypothetical protein